MIKFTTVLFAGLFFASKAAFAIQSPVERFPHSETFRLADGSKILLPLHLNRSNFIILSGVGDSKELAKALRGEDVAPDEVMPGLGLVGLYIAHYDKGDLGPYDELMLTVNVKQSVAGLPETKAYFVREISVTTPLALRAGLDVWGFDKYISDISLQEIGNDLTASQRFGLGGGKTIDMRCSDCATLASVPAGNDFILLSPYRPRRSWAQGSNQGQFSGRAFSQEAGDRFSFNPHSSVGAFLRRIGFAPSQWTIAHGVESAVLK